MGCTENKSDDENNGEEQQENSRRRRRARQNQQQEEPEEIEEEFKDLEELGSKKIPNIILNKILFLIKFYRRKNDRRRYKKNSSI